jgi:YjjG family noncanonical pyrimidine nucleotidase
MIEQYDAIFLDADETLLDYAAAERAAFMLSMRSFGLPEDETTYALYRKHNAEVWSELELGSIDPDTLKVERFRRMLDALGRNGVPLRELSACYIDMLSRQAQLLPGAEEAVHTLARHVPLALITNGLSLVQRRRFAATPCIALFRCVVISEEVGIAKPDPAIFASALHALRVAAERVLYVGDSVSSDMRAAANAGMDFCWINASGAPLPDDGRARFIVRSLAELPALLGMAE